MITMNYSLHCLMLTVSLSCKTLLSGLNVTKIFQCVHDVLFFTLPIQMILGELRVRTDVRQKQIQQENRPPPPVGQRPTSPNANGQRGLHPNQAQHQRRAGPPPVSQKPLGYGAIGALNGARTDRSQIPTRKPQVDEVSQNTTSSSCDVHFDTESN